MKNGVKFCLLIFFVFVSLFTVDYSFAQVKESNNNVWFHYFGKNMISKKVSFSFETTMRYANGFSEKQQYFIRPSLDYQISKKLMGSIGFSHYNTYSYGNPAMNKISIPENHFWIQGTFVHTNGKLKITHRLRDEFRYVGISVLQTNGDFAIDHYDYRNRIRYMLLFNYPLIKKNETTKLFALLGDEVFMNLGTNAGKTFINQNRIIGGLGYNFNANHQIQLSYIHQNIWNYSNTFEESNPTIRLSYITNFDWTK